MENWEIQTGENWHNDGEYSGQSQSRRQLWSVAGFIGAVMMAFLDSPMITPEKWVSNPTLPSDWFSENAVLYIHGQDFSLGSYIYLRDKSSGSTLGLAKYYAPQVPTLTITPSENGIILDPTPLEDESGFAFTKKMPRYRIKAMYLTTLLIRSQAVAILSLHSLRVVNTLTSQSSMFGVKTMITSPVSLLKTSLSMAEITQRHMVDHITTTGEKVDTPSKVKSSFQKVVDIYCRLYMEMVQVV